MRKVLSVMMALLLCIVFSLPVTAAYAPIKIKSIQTDFGAESAYVELDGTPIPAGGLEELQVHPGSELRIYLFGADGAPLFYDQDGMAIPTADVTLSRLRAAQVDLDVSGSVSGSTQAIVELAYSYKTASLPTAAPYISVFFPPRLLDFGSEPFALQLALTLSGKQAGPAIRLAGHITSKEQSLAAGTAAVDLSDGSTAVPEQNLYKVSIAIGDGVTIQSDLQQGKRYFALLTRQSDGPMARLAAEVYTVQVTGFQDSKATVRFARSSLLYVYDGQGAYLGTTGEALPLVDTYYLSDTKLAVLPV